MGGLKSTHCDFMFILLFIMLFLLNFNCWIQKKRYIFG